MKVSSGVLKAVESVAGSDTQEDARLGQEILQSMPGLRLQLARVTRDMELASDLLQDAMVTALNKLRAGELPNRDHLVGYVYQIALNHFRNHRRKDRSHLSDSEDSSEMADSGRPDPADSLGTAQCAGVARKLLQEITSVRDRELLVRFYLYEETKESLCKQFGLSDAHFNRVIFRARVRFRELLTQRGLSKSDLLSLTATLLLTNGLLCLQA